MRIVVISLLALSVSAASATEAPCAAAFEKAHAEYFSKIDDLEKQEFALRTGGYVLGSGVLYCMWRTRSLGFRSSVVMCGGLLGTVLVGSQAYRYSLLSQIRALQEAYKVYEVYYQIDHENFGDEAIQDLFKQTGAQPAQEWVVAHEFNKMMDSGELCGGPTGTKPAVSWDDTIAALVQRKGPLN
jgi:hypothetical protein